MKSIWTLITPEGREFIIGAYVSEGKAKAAAGRKFPSDYLSLCAYPLQQRIVEADEQVENWVRWYGN